VYTWPELGVQFQVLHVKIGHNRMFFFLKIGAKNTPCSPGWITHGFAHRCGHISCYFTDPEIPNLFTIINCMENYVVFVITSDFICDISMLHIDLAQCAMLCTVCAILCMVCTLSLFFIDGLFCIYWWHSACTLCSICI
jgi:hypothetical protein